MKLTNEQRLVHFFRQTKPVGDCLIWTGAAGGSKQKGRYGYVWFDGKVRRLHRVIYYLSYGEWPKVVLHRCDTPLCIAPSHLQGGTQWDNVHDALDKGRPFGRPRKKAAA